MQEIKAILILTSCGLFYIAPVCTFVPEYCLQRIGCFVDTSNHDLEDYIIRKTPPITPIFCRDECKSRQYAYSGTQNGYACLCGQDFGKYGHKMNLCDNGRTCYGNQSLRCGHGGTNDIFMTTNGRQREHLGCFNDGTPYDLSVVLSTGGSNTNPYTCAASCRGLGFLFAGLQDGTKCSCGNTYGQYGSSSTCNTSCTTAGMSHCGGVGSNSIYLTGKDDFWQTKTVAYGINQNIDTDVILDDSEATCIETDTLHRSKDFVIKFSTTAYYQRMTPGISVLVTTENLPCESRDGTSQIYVYVDSGSTNSDFQGIFVTCQIIDIHIEQNVNTCVFRCICTQNSCKEVYVRFMKSSFQSNARICEIRSCYSL